MFRVSLFTEKKKLKYTSTDKLVAFRKNGFALPEVK